METPGSSKPSIQFQESNPQTAIIFHFSFPIAPRKIGGGRFLVFGPESPSLSPMLLFSMAPTAELGPLTHNYPNSPSAATHLPDSFLVFGMGSVCVESRKPGNAGNRGQLRLRHLPICPSKSDQPMAHIPSPTLQEPLHEDDAACLTCSHPGRTLLLPWFQTTRFGRNHPEMGR